MAKRLKLVSGGVPYYVSNTEMKMLNGNAVPPVVETGNFKGLTTDVNLSASFTDAEVANAKIAYPGFIAEPYVAPTQTGRASSKYIYLGTSQNGTTAPIQENYIETRFAVGGTITINVENITTPLDCQLGVSDNPAGPFDVVASIPVVDGQANASFWTRYMGVANTGFNTADLVVKDAAGGTLFTASATGYHAP